MSVLPPLIIHITGSTVRSLQGQTVENKQTTSKRKQTFKDHLTQINSLKLQNNPVKEVVLLFLY